MNSKPASHKVNKRLLSTVFFCFSLLFVAFYLANVVRISFLRQAGVIPMPEEMAFFSRPTNNVVIDATVIIINTASMLVAGYIAAVRTKQNGWLIGWAIGALWSLAYAAVLISYLLNGISVASQVGSPEFIQRNFTYERLNNYIATIPSDFLKSILLCGIGGTLYNFVSRIQQMKKIEKPEVFKPTTYEDILKNNY